MNRGTHIPSTVQASRRADPRTRDHLTGHRDAHQHRNLRTAARALLMSVHRSYVLIDDDRAAADDAEVGERLGVIVEQLGDVLFLAGRAVEHLLLRGLHLGARESSNQARSVEQSGEIRRAVRRDHTRSDEQSGEIIRDHTRSYEIIRDQARSGEIRRDQGLATLKSWHAMSLIDLSGKPPGSLRVTVGRCAASADVARMCSSISSLAITPPLA